MALKTLKPRIATLRSDRAPVLEAKAGTTPRIRGGRWTAIRAKALLDGQYRCVDCGRVSASNEVDHDTPLEQGGSNEPENLKVRCVECHAAKTRREAKARGRGLSGV